MFSMPSKPPWQLSTLNWASCASADYSSWSYLRPLLDFPLNALVFLFFPPSAFLFPVFRIPADGCGEFSPQLFSPAEATRGKSPE